MTNMKHSSTQSFAEKINEKMNKGTQSSLDLYISYKLETARNNPDFNFTPIDQTKPIEPHFNFSSINSYATHSYKEKINPKTFGVVKTLATNSGTSSIPWFIKPNSEHKGVTPSHPALNFEKKTLNFTKNTEEKLSYFSFTQSQLKFDKQALKQNSQNIQVGSTGSNAMAHQNRLASLKQPRFMSGTQSNPAKRFYVKVTSNTKKMDAKPLGDFIKDITDKSDNFLKSNQVTVNGNKITDANYELKPGDVVRVGPGNFIHNSDNMVIVK